MDHDLDIEALKAAALATLAARKTAKVTKDISGKNEQQAEEDLAALRDAALKSKTIKGSEDKTEDIPAISGAPSKFDRGDDDSSSDASDLSLIEEDVAVSEEETIANSEPTHELSVDTEEQPVPFILEDDVDITEFDDDDLILEDELIKLSNNSQTSSTVYEQPASKYSKSVSRITSTKVKNVTHKHSPPRHRRRSKSRSPKIRASKSIPTRQRPRSHSSRDSSSHKHSSSERSNVNIDSNTLSQSRNKQRVVEQTVKSTSDVREGTDSAMRDDANTSPVSNLLDNPLLTEAERETLRVRKEKFSKKISSTKKTIKLKNAKKKTSVVKRLGIENSKIVKSRLKSPEIVESISLETTKQTMTGNTDHPNAAVPNTKAKKRIQDRLGGYADPQTGESRVKKSKRQVSIEVQPESDEESTATSSRKASPETVRRPVLRRENSKANGNTAELVVKKLSSSKRNIWSHRATDSTSLEDEKPTNRSAKLRVGRGDQLEKEDGRKHARPLYSSSNHTKPVESLGKNQSELELDERIRKIKQQNAKLEERQKMIEKEKKMFCS